MAQSKAISIIFNKLAVLSPPILKNLACDVIYQYIIEQPFRLSMIAILYSLKMINWLLTKIKLVVDEGFCDLLT